MRDLGYFDGWIMGWGGEVRGITLAVGGTAICLKEKE